MNIKELNFNFLPKRKHDYYFLVIGLVLLIAVIWIFSGTIGFLVEKVSFALNWDAPFSDQVGFKLEQLKNLGIINQSASVQSTSSTSSQVGQ